MDFEKAYEKFLTGTATEEEVEFVRSEMKKAKALNDVIDNAKGRAEISKAEREEVKRAVKRFNIKTTVRIAVIALSAAIVIALITLGSIFIPVYNTAKDNLTVTEEMAKETAVNYVAERQKQPLESVTVRRIERELEIEGRLKNAHFVYVVDVYNGKDNIVEIEIDGRTGKITDYDAD